MREVRISPDGDAVAIRTDHDADGRRAWGVYHAVNGAAWAPALVVEGWTVVSAS